MQGRLRASTGIPAKPLDVMCWWSWQGMQQERGNSAPPPPCSDITPGVLQNIQPQKAGGDRTLRPGMPPGAVVPKGMLCCLILHRVDPCCISILAFSPKTCSWTLVPNFQPPLLTSKKVLSVALVGLWVIRNLMFL